MTTIDPQVAAAPAGRRTATRRRRPPSVADWITTSDHKKIGRLFIGTVARARARRRRCSVRCSASSGSTPSSDMLDTDAIPQLFSLYRVGAHLRRGRAAPPRPRRGGRAAAARRTSAGLPAPRDGRVLDLARRRRPRRRLDRRQRRSRRRRRRRWSTCSSPLTSLVLLGLIAAAVSVAVVGAHHPGARHEHAPRAAVLVVGARRCARPACSLLPVLVGALVLLYIDHRYIAHGLRRQPGRRLAGSASRSPSRRRSSTPCRRSASPPR